MLDREIKENIDKNESIITDLKKIIIDCARILKRRIKILFIGYLVLSLICFFYSRTRKPEFKAEITFATESSGGEMSQYSNIAAQFGFDLGSGASNAFTGNNLIEFLRSDNLIQKTLFNNIIETDKKLIINEYIKSENKLNIQFPNNYIIGSNRNLDSILKLVLIDINKQLYVGKRDRLVDIITISFISKNEIVSKSFVENLMNNATVYYTNYKTSKTQKNVDILKNQLDSVKLLINSGIEYVTSTSDLNINPIKQTVRTGISKKNIDNQVNGVVYTEILKNYELSKITLIKEVPFVQIIDKPLLPLENVKMSNIKFTLIFSIIGFFFLVLFYLIYDYRVR